MAPLGLSEPAEIAGSYDPEPHVTRETKELKVSAPCWVVNSPYWKAAVV